MKRVVLFLMVMIYSLGSTTVFADNVNNVFLNGRNIDYINTGEDYVNVKIPVRSLFETAGFTVQWFENEQRVTAFNDDFNITMFANDNFIYINKAIYPVCEKMTVEDDMFVLPLSVVSQALDTAVLYENDNIYLSSSMFEDTSGWEYDVFSSINDKRAEHGLQPLVWNGELAKVAEMHCQDMISRNYFAHNTPDGITPFERIKSYGIKYSSAAENLAAGQPTPKSVVDAWMDSDAHRENILNPSLKECGVAFVRGGEYGIYWAQEFATTR